eukprot:3131798-Rhodomonas_salina.2
MAHKFSRPPDTITVYLRTGHRTGDREDATSPPSRQHHHHSPSVARLMLASWSCFPCQMCQTCSRTPSDHAAALWGAAERRSASARWCFVGTPTGRHEAPKGKSKATGEKAASYTVTKPSA